MQIKTKQQLLDEIKKCEKEIKYLIKDEDKKEVFISGTENIKNILFFYEDGPLSESDKFIFDPTFVDFVGNSNKDELKNKLDDIVQAIKLGSPIKESAKTSAKVEMRNRKKGRYIALICVLSVIAFGAFSLGVLGSLEIIPGFWSSLVGVLDCFFGIMFFAWEIYDDKVKESAIDNNDYDVIRKYGSTYLKNCKVTIGKQINKNKGDVYTGETIIINK